VVALTANSAIGVSSPADLFCASWQSRLVCLN